MKFAKRLLMVAGAVALAGLFSVMLAPKAVHAVVATLVQVSNTSANPVPTLSTNISGRTAFDIAVGDVLFSGGSGVSITLGSVPPNTIAVIQNFSGRCAIEQGTSISEVLLSYTGQVGLDEAVAVPGPAIPFGAAARSTFAGVDPNYAFGGSSGSIVSLTIATSASETGSADFCDAKISGYFVAQ